MSSMPAVGVYATIQWKRDQIQRDAKAAQDALKEAFSRTGGIKIPITIDDKGLQAKLDAALSRITVKPIVVPIIFAPVGGGPGSSPVPGVPGGAPGSGGAPGAPDSPASGTFLQRGFARFASLGFMAHAIAQIVEGEQRYGGEMAAAGAGSTRQTQEDMRRQLSLMMSRRRELSHIGFGVVGGIGMIASNLAHGESPFNTGETEIGRIEADTTRIDRKTSAMEKLAAATAHTAEQTREYGYMAAAAAAPDSEGLAIHLADQRRKLEHQLEMEDRHYGTKFESPLTISARTGFNKYAGALTNRQEILRMGATQGMATERLALDAMLAGDTPQAARINFQQKQDERLRELQLKDPALAEKYRTSVAPQERTEFEGKMQRALASDAASSAARIGSMGGKAGESEMRSRGEDFNAAMSTARRSIEEHAATLEREAKAEKDATRSAQLLAEATATRVNGERELIALQAEHNREADRELRTATDEAIHGGLLATGQHRAARDQAVEAQYQEERRKIEESNDPNKWEKINALNMRRDAANAINRRGDTLHDLHIENLTKASAEAARGQTGVGGVLAMEEEIARMREDAGDDPTKLQRVRRFANARRAEMLHDLKPVPQIHGIDQYHDALQMSIMSGHSNLDAINLIKAIQGREGVWPGGGAAGGNAAGGGGNMNAAAQNLNEAANKINKAKAIAVIK